MSSSTSNNNNNNDNVPLLITSHSSYAVGAAESTLGSLTSNASLQQSGESIKTQAVDDMRAANETSTSATAEGSGGSGSGSSTTTTGGLAARVEKAVGDVVGCGGLQEKGAQGQQATDKVKEA